MNTNHALSVRCVPPPPRSSAAIFAFSFPSPSPSTYSKSFSLRLQTTKKSSTTFISSSSSAAATTNKRPNSPDLELLALLRQRKTEQAWALYLQCAELPNPTCLSRLVSQLSNLNTVDGLTRAQSVIERLRRERQLHRLDANSLCLLAVAAAKGGHTTLYASSIFKSMLKSGYLPRVEAWSAVVRRLAAAGDDGPVEAIKVFKSVIESVRGFADSKVVKNTIPNTVAYNAVLNACANLGLAKMFVQLFDEMPEFGCKPNWMTYNVMIKLCARVERRDLLVFVLERMIEKGIPLRTTPHSLVTAYVGVGDLDTAEKLVQAMREGRRDICKILRKSSREDMYLDDEKEVSSNKGDLFEKLLPNSMDYSSEPPELAQAVLPDSRIYTTLMKGYMKAGRIADTMRLLEAMKQETHSSSHPNHVTYTTVISAFVNAGSMDRARLVLAEMARTCIPANLITYNILLKGYCDQLQIDEAEELMREMVDEVGIQPDVISYTILINGCIGDDDCARALSYFNEMCKRRIAPSTITYTTLMKVFSSLGNPNLVNKVFDEMLNDHRVKVDLIAWNMLVQEYCKLGLIEEGKSIIEKMKENGMCPNVCTYRSLANGIALARKPGEALLLWTEIKERCGVENVDEESSSSSSSVPPFKPDERLLDSLACICVRAAFFKTALEIIACMGQHGIHPNRTKYKRMYMEMHSRMFTSKHESRAGEKRRAAEEFKCWLGLPNSYYGSEWRLDPANEDGDQ